MGQYCAERDFIHNSRKMTDAERTSFTIKYIERGCLMLKAPKGA
jgi:hypothetical protein